MTTATAPVETATATVPHGTRPRHWAGHRANPEQLTEWAERFHRDGYLLLTEVLPPAWCDELKAELAERIAHPPNGERVQDGGTYHSTLGTAMFETSAANLRLFDVEPIASLAELLLGHDCHVIHNNSFHTKPGQGITMWHQDDAPHYLVMHGEAPTNIRLPPLLFTANYYLTDVSLPEHGGTEVIPRSHQIGANCPPDLTGTSWEAKLASVDHNCAPAGSVVLFNNQAWHRGGPNTSDRTRCITQITYARRLIGHKYYPFMNYVMPERCHRDASPRLKRLLGFLPHGAYG